MTLRVAVIGISAGLVVACAASPVRAYQEAQVTGGGTIKGKVVYNGEIPTRTVVPTKDQQVCGGVREEPEVKVGADNGVGDAIVYLKEVEQGKAWPAAAQAPTLDNKELHLHPGDPGDPGREAQRPQLRSGPAQHARLLRPADRLQHRPAQSGSDHRGRPAARRDRSGSSATPTAGCSAGSMRSPIRTSR